MTFSEWIQKHAKEPILKVVVLALGFQVLYFFFLAYDRFTDQSEKIELLRESISIGVQQSNRPLIESAMMTSLSNPYISAVLLCSGDKEQIVYPPDSRNYCGEPRTNLRTWAIRRSIIGAQGVDLVVILSPIAALTPMFFLVFISFLMAGAIFWLLLRLRKRFEAEILNPITDGLSADIPLGVSELEGLRFKNLEGIRLAGEKAHMEALVNLSTQVAHDIRSPLAALDTALKDLEALPAEKRDLVRGAVGRIGEIARDLLENYKKPGVKNMPAEKPESRQDLKVLIEPVLAEKRAQYAAKPEIALEFIAAENVWAIVQPAELRRIISNLVNNAVEAFEKGGKVAVELSKLDGRVLLKVSDDGKGIPPEILAKLGQKGETHGKAGGTGLGLYHARTTVETWGGSLKINSKPGEGTLITIALPLAADSSPAAAPSGRQAILLDDDMLVHMNWKMAAKAAGVEFKAYKTPPEFYAAIEALPKDTPIYIDSELGDGLKGEDIAKDLHAKGFTALTMATGHAPEKFAAHPWLKVAGKKPPWQ
ncbi:MAG TPA: hypothetical protein DCZ92_06105 [Elusimicrobia bacterium]|nr:hypothetical protein [Elusimicrobiota bacterium]